MSYPGCWLSGDEVRPWPKTVIRQSQRTFYPTRERYLSAQQALYQALWERTRCVVDFQYRSLLHFDLLQLSTDLETILMFDSSLQAQLGCLLESLLPHGGEINFPQETDNKGTLFTIKNNPNIPHEQLYEYLIGKLVLNPLREQTPNFAYTYAYRHNREHTGYLYREQIDGLTLNQWMYRYGGDDPVLVEILLQIINALAWAFERSNFQHHDLSGDNVIVRELAEAVYVPITIGDEDGYVLTHWIPQIINLGYATATYDGLRLRPPTRVQEHEMLHDLKRLITNLSFQVSECGMIFACQQNLPHQGGSWVAVADIIRDGYGYNPVVPREERGMVVPLCILDEHSFYQRYCPDRSCYGRVDQVELDMQAIILDLNSLLSRDILDDSQAESHEERVRVLSEAVVNVVAVADYIAVLDRYQRTRQSMVNKKGKGRDLSQIINRGHKYYQDVITRLDNFIHHLRSKLYVDVSMNEIVLDFERLALVVQLLPSVVDK